MEPDVLHSSHKPGGDELSTRPCHLNLNGSALVLTVLGHHIRFFSNHKKNRTAYNLDRQTYHCMRPPWMLLFQNCLLYAPQAQQTEAWVQSKRSQNKIKTCGENQSGNLIGFTESKNAPNPARNKYRTSRNCYKCTGFAFYNRRNENSLRSQSTW